MNTSDRMILAAALAATDTDIGEKSVRNKGHLTHVTLHGKTCLTMDRVHGTMTVNGGTVCSRKSTRLMNTLLEAMCGARVRSHNGRWYIRRDDPQTDEEFTGRTVTLEVKKEMII